MAAPLTPVQKAFLAATVVTLLLLLATPQLIARFGWLLAGHVLFGLTIGLMIGMTKSAVVSSALPLLFTFAGGSIVALSIGEDRTGAQLDILGVQLAGFGIGTTIGLVFGVALLKLGIDLPLGRLRD